VTTAKLADNAVSTAKLANGSVSTPKLADGSVSTPKLADGSVSTPKLADGSVSTPKLADGCVNTPKLADGSVSTPKLGYGCVTKDKLSAVGGSDGQVLKLSGGNLTWANDLQGDLTLPYSGSVNSASVAFQVINNGNGAGVVGRSNGNTGVWGETNATNYSAVYGATAIADAAGVLGRNTNTQCEGILGWQLYGVRGNSNTGGGDSYGVYGVSTATNGNGVYGEANNGNFAYAVWGLSTSGYAGFFSGRVQVTGNLQVGGVKNFKIDHPLDPEHKYLYHTSVESPDMMNIYNGNVVLDERGEAWVQLPEWFEALNREFRYQLTCIGGFAPVYIAEEIQNNRYKIAGGRPGMKVSWQVTGIRHDPWAQAHPSPVEEVKPPQEQGTYLHPELYGQPEEKNVGWKNRRQIRQGELVPASGSEHGRYLHPTESEIPKTQGIRFEERQKLEQQVDKRE
jgi:hypothetical protein